MHYIDKRKEQKKQLIKIRASLIIYYSQAFCRNGNEKKSSTCHDDANDRANPTKRDKQGKTGVSVKRRLGLSCCSM